MVSFSSILGGPKIFMKMTLFHYMKALCQIKNVCTNTLVQ